VHDFIAGNPVLIDCARKTMTFFDQNIYGQIYNLNDAKCHKISPSLISGLIKRTGNSNYGIANSKAVDGYIYNYLMTPEQQAQCRRTPHIFKWDEKIANTDDYYTAIKTMCEWAYEQGYPNHNGDKEMKRGEMLKYSEDFLTGQQEEPPVKKIYVAHNVKDPHKITHDWGDR